MASLSYTRLLSLLSLFILLFLFSHLSFSPSSVLAADSQFEGFDDGDEIDDADDDDSSLPLPTRTRPSLTTTSQPDPPRSPEPSIPDTGPNPIPDSDSPSTDLPKPSSTSFDYWDEDEFEGLPVQPQQTPPLDDAAITENATPSSDSDPKPSADPKPPAAPRSFVVEIACGGFLIVFIINYFTGKRVNENIALAWAAKFATKDSIFEKNFSLMGVGDGDDSPLLLKEGQNVFKFYASGRRCCQGLLATMELKSRHDLISSIFNLVVPSRDEISIEVYMNDDAMDHVVFALARKKSAKAMQKEVGDLQKFAGIVSPPTGRKWVSEDLAVISESKEVAGDLITEAVLEQVFGDKAFQKFGKGFIYMHFSDQHPGSRKKMLLFKFALPDAGNMADMTRLVALVPYYIDLIGRYKLSSSIQN
ncbi:unnamed protein product [Malus baccata var. baccata]